MGLCCHSLQQVSPRIKLGYHHKIKDKFIPYLSFDHNNRGTGPIQLHNDIVVAKMIGKLVTLRSTPEAAILFRRSRLRAQHFKHSNDCICAVILVTFFLVTDHLSYIFRYSL